MDYLVGLLIGDYLLQNDWQANNKLWTTGRWKALPVSLFHALLVTGAIAGCALVVGREWALWKLVVIWLTHTLQDWLRLATVYMGAFKQFGYFKEHLPQAYIWGMIVVDNVFHLVLLFFLANL